MRGQLVIGNAKFVQPYLLKVVLKGVLNMPPVNQTNDEWWVNEQTPDNLFGKSEDCEAYLDYLGAPDRSLTPEIAAEPLVISRTSERHSFSPAT